MMLMMMISTHTPLAGRDIYNPEAVIERKRFLLTRPSRGVTSREEAKIPESIISTHTPLAGRDRESGGAGEVRMDFYSHAPRGA